MSQIAARGPLTVHEFMRQCLLHPEFGYYNKTSAERLFGAEGDFVTAPELSQLFGELVGVWLVSEWLQLGSPETVRIVEIGPGRGTLMSDILRATTAWPDFRVAASEVRMVEPSRSLRQAQQRQLDARPRPSDSDDGDDDADGPDEWVLPDDGTYGTRVQWHESLAALENDGVPLLVIGQEVLDAFPAHQFVATRDGWREKLVDIDGGEAEDFRFVLAPSPTPASVALHSALPKPPYVGAEADDELAHTVEICPGALAVVEHVAHRLARSGGAALFVDYGENRQNGDTIRGFSQHKQVSVFHEPGTVDLTIDVDFGACGRQAASVAGVAAYGAVPQGVWLQRMGIAHRVEALLSNDGVSDRQTTEMISAVERLCDPEQMGLRYKCLALVNADRRSEPPAGFVPGERASSVGGPPIKFPDTAPADEPDLPPVLPAPPALRLACAQAATARDAPGAFGAPNKAPEAPPKGPAPRGGYYVKRPPE
ncbi:S-adenosyl-L-methionine-dependent methyltransferase [Pelagophyceae sp. CCMP2097]|nr:S-adenosyl-L-methionine-dependent methyltransferase [Pelagophyceae sp. CCMP2097]